MKKFFEKSLKSEIVYKGKIFDIVKDEVELYNGAKTIREVVAVHSSGVVIVAQNEDKILLVQQFRYPVKEAILELPAGKIDVNEDPFSAAKRELKEETGYVAKKWSDLGFVYTSVGFCTEKLYFFKADDLTFEGQNPDENEIIDFIEMDLRQVFDMIKNNEINDAKTIAALMRAYKQ